MRNMDRDFFYGDSLEIAKSLIGCTLSHTTPQGEAAGIIVETEAYLGERDAAAHSYKGKTERCKVMFGPGGYAYVYLIYGMYYCMNIVTNGATEPEAILIRALEPTKGIELQQQRRKNDKLKNLCSGPGKLCMALGIDKHSNGLDLLGDTLSIKPRERIILPDEIEASPRINIDYAGEAAAYPWRFYLKDSPYISVKPKKRA